MPIEAAPIVVDPSGDFLGVDGAWSTFSITAGTPPQQLQVLASTEVASTWVVAPEGCGPNDAANCTQARGGEYDDTKSSTWNVKDMFQLGAEGNLGYTGNTVNGSYGYDTVGLPGKPGAANISVNHQVIAGITTEAFYVGSLGLSNQPINFTDSSDSSPSLLTSLKNENLIPSLSYGYTAGASYQPNGGVGASLTLGGYDASRFTPNDVSFTFAPIVVRQLVVAIPSITYSTSKIQTPLLSQGIMALVDSTVPYLWLPQEACHLFETAFGISWDSLNNLYLVNDTIHDTLVQENPSVIFELANSLNGPSVNITLPYASFNLEANYPLVKKQLRYFPLQRASDENSYTLGRTFFQESFLIVDYEHSNFSISQATFDPSAPSHIIPISSTDTTGTAPSNPTLTGPSIVKSIGNSSHGIGTGPIAGIAIVIVLIASLIGAFFVRRMYRKKRDRKAKLPGDEPKVALDMLDMQKHDSSEDPEVEFKKFTTVTITPAENPMTPLSEMEGIEFFGPNAIRPQSRIIELPGSPANRSELSSPEPLSRSEAPSPSPEKLRSELSTPEPMYSNSELPTPDPSHELASPSISAASSGHPSPSLDGRHPAFRSPLPIPRPLSERHNSSESETGFSRDGMPRRPTFHRRYYSDESDGPSLQSRPSNLRMDSSDSESGFIHANRPSNTSPTGVTHFDPSTSDPDIITPAGVTHSDPSTSDFDGPVSSPFSNRAHTLTHLDSSSESESSPITPPARHVHIIASTCHSANTSRPAIRGYTASPRQTVPPPQTMQRMDSTDSEPWETRLESASPSTESPTDISRFNSMRRSRGEGGEEEEEEEGGRI